MTTISEMFPKSLKLAYEARQSLSQLHNGLVPSSQLFAALDELNRQLNLMEKMIDKQVILSEQRAWRHKISQLRAESKAMHHYGEVFVFQAGRTNASRECNDYSSSLFHDPSAHYGSGASWADETKERRDELLKQRYQHPEANNNYIHGESDSLGNCQILLGHLLHSGQGTKQGLARQKSRMKEIQKTVLDMGIKLGLSKETLRTIQQQEMSDAHWVLGGMLVTLCVLYLFWS